LRKARVTTQHVIPGFILDVLPYIKPQNIEPLQLRLCLNEAIVS